MNMLGKRKRGKSKILDTAVSKAVEFSVETLLSTALEEILFAKDINSHLESLQHTKNTIESLFLDADKVESLGHAQRSILERLSCAVDKVDDLLDAKAARVKMRRLMGGRSMIIEQVQLFFSASSNPFISAFKDALQVRAIREELDSVSRDNAQFGNPLGMVNQMCVGTRSRSGSDVATEEVIRRDHETWSLINKDVVIGRDRDRDNVLNMLFGSSSNEVEETLYLVPIVGIGGIGKSTLAQYVYNDEKVKIKFDLHIWVWATQNFDIMEILQKILASVTDEKSDQGVLDMLQRQVRRQISGKKYFLVLDNIWNHRSLSLEWGKLREVLLCGAAGSKILITTRSESVARIVGTKRNPYMLSGLAPEDSWLLFQQIAFRPGQEHGVEAIGKEIARMCRDVPLVVRTIGGLLAEKCTVKEWQAFRDDEFANLSVYGSNIIDTLKLSYNPLDPRLKLCFAYCALFPKGWIFESRKLISIFIALGYVKKKYKNQSLMDAGEECLLSLVKRGFFNNGIWGDCGSISHFKMHDLIHNLAVSVAGCKLKMVESKEDELDYRVRHVSLSSKVDICLESLSKMRHLRSLLVMGPRPRSMGPRPRSACPKLTALARFFPYLRVLSLQQVGLEEVPTSIGKLIHLRHLNLSKNPFSELPKSIKELVHLQSLDLWLCKGLKQLPGEIGELSNLLSLNLLECENLEKLPGEMSNLINLTDLQLRGCDRLRQMPIGLGNLTNLQRLDYFVVTQSSPDDVGGDLAELNTLNNLERKLTIVLRGRWCESRAANLQMKDKLMHLELDLGVVPYVGGYGYYSLEENHNDVLEGLQPHANLRILCIRGYNEESLPSWMMKNQLHCSLPNLMTIEIFCADNCKVTNLCSFGRLPHLRRLRLYGLNSVEYIEEDEDDAPVMGLAISEVAPLFPSLKDLMLRDMPKLKGWRRDSRNTKGSARPPSFPRLKHLQLEKVGFEVVPDEFRGLSSLRTLKIHECERLKEIPERIGDVTSLNGLAIHHCPKLMPLPKQIGNLPNLESISISGCPGAYAEWWRDPTLPDCPIKQLHNDKKWKRLPMLPGWLCYSKCRSSVGLLGLEDKNKC